jgi:hypothetical protein
VYRIVDQECLFDHWEVSHSKLPGSLPLCRPADARVTPRYERIWYMRRKLQFVRLIGSAKMASEL